MNLYAKSKYMLIFLYTCLPHTSTLSRWHQTVDGRLGFSTEAFSVLKDRADETNYR